MDSSSSPELEQMRVFLEEKDKHIRDLMDTLKNFHVCIVVGTSNVGIHLTLLSLSNRTINSATLTTLPTIRLTRLPSWPPT